HQLVLAWPRSSIRVTVRPSRTLLQALIHARRAEPVRRACRAAAVRSARHRHPAVADPADSCRLHPQAPSRLPSSPPGRLVLTDGAARRRRRLLVPSSAHHNARAAKCSVLPSASVLCSVLLLCSAGLLF